MNMMFDEALKSAILNRMMAYRHDYPLLDDRAFELICDVINFRDHMPLRAEVLHVEKHNDMWTVVIYSCSDEQHTQALELRKKAIETKYKLVDVIGRLWSTLIPDDEIEPPITSADFKQPPHNEHTAKENIVTPKGIS